MKWVEAWLGMADQNQPKSLQIRTIAVVMRVVLIGCCLSSKQLV